LTSVRVREVLFRVYPQDHTHRGHRHVHGLIGSVAVIVDLMGDGSVRVAQRNDAVQHATRSEVRKVLSEAAEGFDRLAEAWEEMHRG